MRDEESKDVESTGSPLPGEVWYHTGTFITDTKSKAALAQTSQYFHRLFQPDVDIVAAPLVKQLLQYAIDREPREQEILGMLDKNPGLITKYGEIREQSNRLIGGTIYRILLGTFNPLWKKVDRYFEKIFEGEEEREKQINAQFPIPYDTNAREKYDIHRLITTIIDDLSIRFDATTQQFQMKETTGFELQQFINYYAPKENEIITTGLYFDPLIYVDILKAYAARFKDFKNDEQRSLYGCLVEGGIQKFFTTYLAKLTCRGTPFVIDHFQKLDDSALHTRLNDGSDFYSPGLGISHFVYSSHAASFSRQQRRYDMGDAFQTLCKMIVTELETLIQQARPKNRWCAIL